MTQEKDSNDKFSVLRSQAEELLGTVSVDQKDISALSPEEVQVLVHELRVHQIELEMQNVDLRQAQIKLEELKDRYLDLYDFAPVGYMTLNDKGLILEANLTAVRLLGVERTKLIKMFLSHFVCQEFVNPYYSYLKQVFESQSKQTCDIKLTRKDGTVFYAQLESIPVQDKSGQFKRCRTILTDISEHKRAEEALRKSEEQFRLMFQRHNAVMLLIEPATGKIINANPSAQKLYGYELSELHRMSIQQINTLPPDQVAQERERALLEKRNYFIFPHRLATGEIRTVEVHSSPIDLGGQRVLFSIIHDITERKLADEQLRESEEKFRFLTEHMGDIVWTSDLNFRTTYVSPSIKRILGFSPEERKRQTIEEQLTPESLIKVKEILAVEFQREMEGTADLDREIAIETEYYRQDGSTVWLDHKVKGIRDPQGTLVGLHGLSRDITDIKRAEEDRENLRAQLLQSQKMETMGTLAGGIAHDFNNMLQVIFSYSDMLLADKNEGDPGYEGLQKILKTSQDAADLVQRIRIFGRKAEMNLVPLDLNHQIDEVTKLLSSTLPKTIDIEIHLTKDPVIIKADSSQIAQMVMNLAVNANEAMPQGGRLSIQTENIVLDDDYCRPHVGVKPGPHVMLTVSDTGRGIDKGLMERIFDPFYSTKMRDYHKGTGLGLSVVQGIVQQHGGHITVESEVGKGTIFRMYFPALEVEIVPEYVEKEIPYPAGGNETILLVEDWEMVRELGVIILEKFGYTVLSACDGQEALEVYEKEQGSISLVILDIIMPRMDGKECLVELLRINPTVKVIISSGVGYYDLINDIVKIGAKGAVNKPYGMRQLLGMVREVLDGD